MGPKHQRREGGGSTQPRSHSEGRGRPGSLPAGPGRRSRKRRWERRAESPLSSAVPESKGPAPWPRGPATRGYGEGGERTGTSCSTLAVRRDKRHPPRVGPRVPDSPHLLTRGVTRRHAHTPCPHAMPTRLGSCKGLSVTLRVVITLRGPGSTSRDLRAGGEPGPRLPSRLAVLRWASIWGYSHHEGWKRQVWEGRAHGNG